MAHDFKAVFWKELTVLRRAYRKPSSYLSTAMYVMFFGIFPAIFLKSNFVTSPLTLFYLALAPLVTGSGMATLAFAGERENHTLETLLASRLSDLAILLGKIAVYTLYAWLYVPLCIGAGWLTVSLMTGQVLVYKPELLLGGLFTGWLVALFSTNMGTLASLRAGTMKEAGRKLQGVYLLFVAPYIGLNLLPQANREQLLANLSQAKTGRIALAVSLVLIVINAAFIVRAIQQFKRQQMILD